MSAIKINRIRLLSIAILLIVVAVVGFVFFFNQLRTKSKAAPTGTATLSLVAAGNPPMDESGNVPIGVELDPNGSATNLYSFDVAVTYDPSKMEYQNAGGVEANVTLAAGELKQQITQVDDHTIRIAGTRTSAPFSTASRRIADITFKMKSGQSFPAAFSWGATQLETTNYVKIPLTIVTNSSVASSSTAPAAVALSFQPATPAFENGSMVSVDVMLNTGGRQVGAAAVSLIYEPTILTYTSTLVNTGIFNGTAVTPAPLGKVITFQVSRNTPISGTIRVATLRFTAKALGTANFSFNKDDSSVYAVGTTSPDLLTAVSPASVTVVEPGTGLSGPGNSLVEDGGGGNGKPGVHMENNGDIVHVNGIVADQAPFRYEQAVKLEKGDYILSGSARVYTARGRGVLIALACGQSDCGDGKKLNDVFGKTPLFALSSDFQMQQATIHISDNQKDKKLVVRIFVEDGSEADFDYVSLTDVWGGERLTNSHFDQLQQISSPRVYPEFWDMDGAGQVLSTIDRQQGNKGSLFINSSSRR